MPARSQQTTVQLLFTHIKTLKQATGIHIAFCWYPHWTSIRTMKTEQVATQWAYTICLYCIALQYLLEFRFIFVPYQNF